MLYAARSRREPKSHLLDFNRSALVEMTSLLRLFCSAHQELLVIVCLLKRLDKRIHGSLNVVAVGEHTTHCPNERRLLRTSSRSSRRGADATGSIAGKMRCSANERSSFTSMLPVPLNSSKITSSIFEPVSIRADAKMVRLPPPSILRAAPKTS